MEDAYFKYMIEEIEWDTLSFQKYFTNIQFGKYSMDRKLNEQAQLKLKKYL